MPLQEKDDVRDLGFIAWSDPYARLEDYDSRFFKDAVKEEDQILQRQIDKIPSTIKYRWLKSFSDLPKNHKSYYTFVWNSYVISMNESSRLAPSMKITKNNHIVLDARAMRGFSIDASRIVIIRDLSDGKESMTLDLYDSNLNRLLTIDKVGETANIDEKYLYYIEAQDIYWFNKILRMDIKTKKVVQIYKENNKKWVLQIKKPEGQPDIFIIRTNAIYQDIGIIQNTKVKWISKGFGKKIPINKTTIAFDSQIVIDSENISYPDDWKLVDAKQSKNSYVFIFTKDTFHTLWSYNKTGWHLLSPKETICEIKFSLVLNKLIIGYPNKPDAVASMDLPHLLTIENTLDGPTYEIKYGSNPVPWFAVQSSPNPKAVVICGYGSYGMSTKKLQSRLWLPWLQQNFMVVTLCVRGGGENGDQWWDASRTAKRRHVGISDFVNGVNYIQSHFGFNSKNTVIYGRSAGGFLVTAACLQLLDKITVVYAAKPYTDVLRTTSNLKEPQTEAETEEFGLTYNNPLDFVEIVKISPYENIIKTAINPVILLTGGTNDTEVGIYMPLKYAKRLRDFEWKNVFCRVAHGEGHFTDNDKEMGEALDGALCDYFITRQ